MSMFALWRVGHGVSFLHPVKAEPGDLELGIKGNGWWGGLAEPMPPSHDN